MSQDVEGSENGGGLAAIPRSPQEIEYEIERTRERMSSNLDALGERLRPGSFKRQARRAVAAIGLGLVLLLALRARGRRRVSRESARRRVRRVA